MTCDICKKYYGVTDPTFIVIDKSNNTSVTLSICSIRCLYHWAHQKFFDMINEAIKQ